MDKGLATPLGHAIEGSYNVLEPKKYFKKFAKKNKPNKQKQSILKRSAWSHWIRQLSRLSANVPIKKWITSFLIEDENRSNKNSTFPMM